MRVAQVSLHVRAGGAGRAAERVHLALRAQGVDSTFFVDDADVASAFEAARPIAHARRLALATEAGQLMVKLGASELEGIAFHLVANLARSLREFDVVHLHWVEGALRAPELWARIARERPIVWTLHDTQPFTGYCVNPRGCERFTKHCGSCPQLVPHGSPMDWSFRMLARRRLAYRRFPAVAIAPSTWMRDTAKRSAVLAHHDVRHVPNGVDVTLFSPPAPADVRAARTSLGLPLNAFLVGFAGAVPMQKGVELLVDATRHLAAASSSSSSSAQRTMLVVCGNGPIPPPHIEHIHLGNLAGDARMSLFMRAIDVLALPSRFEALSNVMVEALACGRPVVAFAVGGIPDGVLHERTGLLVPPEDVDAMGRGLARLRDDSALRERLGRQGRAHVEERFDITKVASATLSIYQEVLAHHRAAHR